MSFNREYLIKNLPARYRREDDPQNGGTNFLRRFVSFWGETLDGWDDLHEQFSENINPKTASEEFINFWLERLFGWTYFPRLFTLRQKRTLYANFAQHLARRGTARGIELWLRDFACVAKVWLREDFYGEFDWAEPGWNVSGPLLVVVEVVAYLDWNSHDVGAYGENFYGENFVWGEPPIRLTYQELVYLLRFFLPVGQQMAVVWRRYESAPANDVYVPLDQVDPNSAITSK